MRKPIYLTVLALASAGLLGGCKKDKTTDPEPETPVTPAYEVPTTYNFTNADYSSSTKRIDMLGELTTYMRSTHTTTASTQPTLSAQKMKDLFANQNNPFSSTALNTSGIQLKDKASTQYGFVAAMEASFDDAAPASTVAAANPTVTTASSGSRGKLVSSARAILVDGNGFEYKELAEKGVMGAVFYYQATTILANIDSYDNSTPVNGATAQERAWDEAFGYFGVPAAFPTTTVGLKNWGSYCNSVNVAINCNSTIMNAFLKGRAAISNKDNAGRDEARNTVIATWEKVAAAKCISYLKGAKTSLGSGDAATTHHNLSEGYGFVTGFRYNPNKTISDADIATLLGYFGTNLFNLSPSNLDLAIAKLEAVFGLTASSIP